MQPGAETGGCWSREEPLRMDTWAPPNGPPLLTPSQPHTGRAGEEGRGRQELGWRGSWPGLCREPPVGKGWNSGSESEVRVYLG